MEKIPSIPAPRGTVKARAALKPVKVALDWGQDEMMTGDFGTLTPVDSSRGCRYLLALVCGGADCGVTVGGLARISIEGAQVMLVGMSPVMLHRETTVLEEPRASQDDNPNGYGAFFVSGFVGDGRGIFRLSHRAERQWRHARAQRIPWKDFVGQSRRPKHLNIRDYDSLRSTNRRLGLPEEDWTMPTWGLGSDGGAFICPVCGRLNEMQIAPETCDLLLASAGRPGGVREMEAYINLDASENAVAE